MNLSISDLTHPLVSDVRLTQGYLDYVKKSRQDTKSRVPSALLATLLIAWITTPVFAALWLSLVMVNEYFVVKIYQRLQRLGYVDRLSIAFSTANTLYGTFAWCVAAVYLSLSGDIGSIILGVCIIIGVVTHATFNKISYSYAVWATVIPVAMTMLALPFLVYERGVTDTKSSTAMLIAFTLVMFYFVSAARYNLSVRKELLKTLSGLSDANMELEQHKQHLSELVEIRTSELNEEKVKLQQSLEQERRLNEMQTEFVSMASHEFRTPLAIIDGHARRIRQTDEQSEPSAVHRRADAIRAAVKRMTFLLERTLDSSRLASGKISISKSRFDIREQIQDVVSRQRDLYPNHDVQMDLDDCPSRLFGDARLIDTVLSNLVSNAMKYSQNNPTVLIRTETTVELLRIKVRDTGIGIPRKELSEITTRFFRSSNTSGIPGTGIGLNLVRTLVEMHAGRFDIDSEEGQWTEVTIELPTGMAELPQAETA